MWNLLESWDLFTRAFDDNGNYHPNAHLAEMIALLGPPPKEIVDREREGLKWNWSPAAQNAQGKLCTTASEWYGGAFFDEDGKFLMSLAFQHQYFLYTWYILTLHRK